MVKAYYVRDILLHCGVNCPWNACVALVSGQPVAHLAFLQTYYDLPEITFALVVSIMLCCGFHCEAMNDCRLLSGLIAIALTPSSDAMVCILMF